MNTNKQMDYTAPELEVIQTLVEQGFEASWGDYGEAGDDFDKKDFGEF